jgi:hypothetical protein
LLPSLCSAALTRGASPDLAAALDGVMHAKLFLGGEAVQASPRVTLQEVLDLAADAHIGVLLPAGQGQVLCLVGPTAPAVKL